MQSLRFARTVLPRGPVARLSAPPVERTTMADSSASRDPASGVVLARDDWNAGRDLSTEEKRCGMLLRLRDMLEDPHRSNDGHAGLKPRSESALPEAVVKAQTSDFQVNEIDSAGSAAFLESAPKGRWRKISRQKTMLVENTASPFSDRDKTYNPLVLSHGEYVRRIGRLPHETPALQFVLYRDGQPMDGVLNRFRYEIGVDADAVRLRSDGLGLPHPDGSSARAPPGGSFGCVSQYGCCVGVTRDQLAHVSRHYNLHPLLLDPRGYHALGEVSSLSAAPWGYFYRILLRCVSAEEAEVLDSLHALAERGFVNYFGIENFGLSDNALFELAGLAAGGDHLTAVGCYFQSLAESSPLHYDHFMAYVNAEPSTAAASAATWAAACKSFKCTRRVSDAVASLVAYHSAHEGQSSASPDAEAAAQNNARLLWGRLGLGAAAQQSAGQFVWNAMATQRLLSGGGSRVVVGDVVSTASRAPTEAGEGGAATGNYTVVVSAEEAAQFDITDVVLPVPAAGRSHGLFPTIGSLTQGLFEEFATAHRLDFLFDSAAATDDGTPLRLCEYRPLIAKPLKVQAAVLRDPSSLSALKNDLFVRQERRSPAVLDLDYAGRVREPSVYNVSERFAERMGTVRRRHAGTNSVVLTLALPAGSSPLVALREVFALRYPNFSDLYFSP